MTDFERRILSYLDQRGPRSRQSLAADLMTTTRKNHWPQALTRLGAKFTARLREQKLVGEEILGGRHDNYFITKAGRDALRLSE